MTSPLPANRPVRTRLLRRNVLPETRRRTTCLLSPRRGSRIPSVSTIYLPRGEIFSDCPERGRGDRGERLVFALEPTPPS